MSMKRREILLTVAALLVLIVLPSTGYGLNPWDWKYGLAQEQQIIIRDCVLEGRAQVKALSAAGRPKEAAELEAILKNLENRKYSRTNNPIGYAKGAYAHVYSWSGIQTIHLYNSFFELSRNPSRALTPEMTKDKAQRIARLEQLSLLIHEYWHTNYQSAFDFGRPEGEAYQTQYKWLRLFGVSDGMVMSVVKDQLAKNNITPVEPPPLPVPPKPPAADPKDKGATICASYMTALQRDVAAKKNPGSQYRLEFTRAYAYDAKTNSCVGSHIMWSSYNGGKWYEALVYYSPEKPAHENVGRIVADYTKKYPDLKWQ
jgi:hypothetical protein